MRGRRSLYGSQDAVSPVVGVALLVSIVVLLSATTAGFVTQFEPTAEVPQVSFELDTEPVPESGLSMREAPRERSGPDTTASLRGVGSLVITHTGGDSIPADSLTVTVDGNDISWATLAGSSVSPDDELSAGSTVEIPVPPGTTTTVSLTYVAPDGDSSAQLASWNVEFDGAGGPLVPPRAR